MNQNVLKFRIFKNRLQIRNQHVLIELSTKFMQNGALLLLGHYRSL